MLTFSPESPAPATVHGRLEDGVANGMRELGCPNSTDSACTFPDCFCHHPMAKPLVSRSARRVDELLAEVQRLKLDKGAAERVAAMTQRRLDESLKWQKLWKARYKGLAGNGFKGHVEDMAARLSRAVERAEAAEAALAAATGTEAA